MLDAVTRGYLALHPASAAQTLARLEKRDAADAFNAMPRPLAAQVLEYMAPASAAVCLGVLPAAVAGEILSHTALPAAVALLRMLDAKHAQAILQQLPRAKAARLKLRLRFSEWVIGTFVEDDILTLSPNHRVGDALRLFRASGKAGRLHTIPVVDAERRLLGIVDLGDLLSNPDRRTLQQVMQPVEHVLNARAPLQTVVDHPAWTIHSSLPVINRNGIFQGMLHRSRVLREEEAHRMSEIVERNEWLTTRTALADIFWLAVGALFSGPPKTDERDAREN